jgi:hypothetical protein
MATGYGLDGRGSFPGRGKRLFSTTPRLDLTWDPPCFPSNGQLGTRSQGVKRKGHEAGHSPLSSAEVKNGGAVPALRHMSS